MSISNILDGKNEDQNVKIINGDKNPRLKKVFQYTTFDDLKENTNDSDAFKDQPDNSRKATPSISAFR